MKMMHLTRRGFLRAACVVAGGAMISLRMAGVAVARFRDIRDYMLDRIHGVYGADAAFPVRASQDNAQVRELYAAYLKRPLGPFPKNCCIPAGQTSPPGIAVWWRRGRSPIPVM